MRPPPHSAVLVALCACGTGCAFDAGTPFGTVTATLSGAYELRDDRDRGDGFQKLTSELEVRLSALVLVADAVELVDLWGVDAVTFDPSNPPPGYGLCHNGHCHRDDGALVDYEDIAAELGGATGSSTTRLTLLAGELDVLTGAVLTLACVDACTLGRGHVGRVRLGVSELSLEGEVRDGLATPRFDGVLPLAATVSLAAEGAGGVLEAAVDLPLDDDHEPQITVALTLTASAALLDDAIGDDGALSEEALRAAFAEQRLATTIERTEP